MFYIYILQNREGKHYIGFSGKDPEERTSEHNQAKSRWTRYKGPWRLVYSEAFETKQEAFLRERQIKSFKGGKAFKALIQKNTDKQS